MYYPESLINAWKRGERSGYSMLLNSNASDYIKKILIAKAKNKKSRRYFGEAFIASNIAMNEGWYNSFKWLTARKWVTGSGLKNEYERSFYNALSKYIDLSALQSKVIQYYNKHKAELNNKKPVAPDLWVIDPSGAFHFIEAKLPGDTLKPHQRAGLLLINQHLKHFLSISITIVILIPLKDIHVQKKLSCHDNSRQDSRGDVNKEVKKPDLFTGEELMFRIEEGNLISKDRVVHLFYGGRICRNGLIYRTETPRWEIKKEKCHEPKQYKKIVAELGLEPCKDCHRIFDAI